MTAAEKLLDVRSLRLTVDGVAVVDDVSFDLTRQEIVALVGESGCGKSITALAIMGLLPPAIRLAGGEILLGDRDLATLDERALQELRGNDVSIIFQEPTASLDPRATVGSQIVEAITAHQSLSRAAAKAKALDILRAVGIPDPERRFGEYPFQLSGGMCQRVMIAIAIVCGPRLLIADEPTTALDVTIQAQILDLMKALVRERGATVLLITHDMGVVADTADRVVVMYAGRVAEVAGAEALFAAPRHPYTALLLASVPTLDAAPKAALATIEGTVPPPREFGEGCRFASRCPLADSRCRAEQPPLAEVGAGHRAACWHSDRVSRMGLAA